MADYVVLTDCPFPSTTIKQLSGEYVSEHKFYKADGLVTFVDAEFSPLPDSNAKAMVPHHFQCLDEELEALRQEVFAEERETKAIREQQHQVELAGQAPTTQALKALGETITEGLKEAMQVPAVSASPKRGPGRPPKSQQPVSTPVES